MCWHVFRVCKVSGDKTMSIQLRGINKNRSENVDTKQNLAPHLITATRAFDTVKRHPQVCFPASRARRRLQWHRVKEVKEGVYRVLLVARDIGNASAGRSGRIRLTTIMISLSFSKKRSMFLRTKTVRFSPLFPCTFWVNNTSSPAAISLCPFFVLIAGTGIFFHDGRKE